jgi:hypothetical protein
VALSAPAEVTTTAPSSTATARPNPVTDPETPVTSAEVWRLWNVHFKSPVVASATRRNELTEPPSPFSDARETTPSETVSPFIDPAPFDVSAGSPLGVSFGTSTASKVQRPSSVATTALTSALDAFSENFAAFERARRNTDASPLLTPNPTRPYAAARVTNRNLPVSDKLAPNPEFNTTPSYVAEALESLCTYA